MILPGAEIDAGGTLIIPIASIGKPSIQRKLFYPDPNKTSRHGKSQAWCARAFLQLQTVIGLAPEAKESILAYLDRAIGKQLSIERTPWVNSHGKTSLSADIFSVEGVTGI